MQKLIVNGRFLVHQVTGVERYAREILEELDKLIDPNKIEMAIPKEAKDIPKYKNIKITKVGKLNNRMWEHLSFPLYVKKQGGISLNLCNVAPLPCPGIVCMFDAKIKVHPEYFSKKFLLWYNLLFYNSAKRSKLILTDSEAAKKDLLKFYPFIKEEKIRVIYPAWQHYERIKYDEDTLSKYKLDKEEYFFAMGSMEPNKNFKWIAEMAKKTPNWIFVVAGAINEKVFADGLGFDCPENMKLLGYVSDEEAKTLMRDCKAFLFPTFYEGFGIPPLEAISAGAKQVIVSNTEVMHEVFGDNVIYVDPNNFNVNINELISNKPNSLEYVLSKYSWKNSALLLLEQIQNIGVDR